MDRGFYTLLRAVEGFLVRLGRRPAPPSGTLLSNANPQVTNLAGRWPDAESLLARRTPAAGSSQSETTGEPQSS